MNDKHRNGFSIPPGRLAQTDGDIQELRKLFLELEEEEIEVIENLVNKAKELVDQLPDFGSLVSLKLHVEHSETDPEGEQLYHGEAILNLRAVLKALKLWKEYP